MQFTSCNVLLACGVAHRVGSFGRSGQLLASSALVFSVDHPFCYGSRLRGQLAQEPLVSLCGNRTAVSGCGEFVLTRRSKHDARELFFGMDVRTAGDRHRISAGVGICQAVQLIRVGRVPDYRLCEDGGSRPSARRNQVLYCARAMPERPAHKASVATTDWSEFALRWRFSKLRWQNQKCKGLSSEILEMALVHSWCTLACK